MAMAARESSFRLVSAAFAANQPIPVVHSCDGAGSSPPLRWDGTPSGTRSLALVVHDPDAPSGDFTHWLVYDLPPTITALPSGQYTSRHFPLGGLQGRNSFGQIGYGAPCPPLGAPHHYHFDLYALSQPNLGLTAGASQAEVEAAMQGKILAKAALIGTYGRRP
jgi:Raf kinase inhibitor-like YbhB/YbcL family protein